MRRGEDALTEWRRSWLSPLRVACAGVVLAIGPALAPGEGPPSPANAPAQEVDPATKKLMAANGLLARGLFKLAGGEYAEFIGLYPQHPDLTAARYSLAICHYRLSDFEKAAEVLGQVVQDAKFEKRDEALAVLGHCQLTTKHYDQALATLDELLTKYPNSPQAEVAGLNRAQAYYLAGKHKESADACQKLLQQYPKSEQRPAAFYFLALSQRALGQNGEAAKTLTQLTQEAPNSRYQLDATLLMGQALEAQGNLDASIEQYRRMLAAAPATRKGDAQYSLGVALYKAAKYDEAAQELTAVLADPGAANYAKPAKLQLGLVQLAAHKIPEARATLNAVAQNDAARAADARYGLAQCDIADKKFEAARTILDELSHVQPAPANAAQIALDRAVCLMELGKFEPAAGELEAFAGQYPKATQLPEAIYRRAFCLHKLAKYDQSHAVCVLVAQLPASDFSGPAAELGAENLFLLAKYADAAKGFEAIAAGTKDAKRQLQFRLRVGQCAYFGGDYAKAAELLAPLAANPAVASTEDLQPAIFLLGDALLQQGKNAEAATALGQFITVTKADKREAQFKLAIARLRAKDEANAEKTLTELTAGPADSIWVQRGLLEYAQLSYKAAKPDPAAIALNKLLAPTPLPAPPDLAAPGLYLLAWIDFDAKRYPVAAARWQQTAEKYPTDKLAPDAAFQRGVALKEGGKLDDAIAAFQAFASAHADSPNAPKARQLAAACLSTQGKDEQASAMLASLAIGPAAADSVLYDLAWAQRKNKNTPAAMEAYRRLIGEHADSKLAPAARTELAEFLYNDQKYPDAAALLEAAVADKTADPKVLAAAAYRLGWCYEKLGKPEKAAEIFTAFVQQHPEDELSASAGLQAGIAYAEQGKFDKAELSLAGMLKKFPQYNQAPVAFLKLGEAQAELNEFDASGQTYTTFLERFPKDPFAYRAQFGIGWSLENRKHFDESRAAYEKVISKNNGETAARAQFQIGETWLAEGKFEKAIPALLAVDDVYLYPKWSARALLEAGRAFEQLKQPDQAAQQYSQVVAKYKDAPEAEMAQGRLKALKG